MSAAQSEEKRRAELAKRVAINPFEYLTVEETGLLFNFSAESMTDLLKLRNAPIVKRKLNPAIFHAWLREQGQISKAN